MVWPASQRDERTQARVPLWSRNLRSVLDSFSAGKAVPGSGSANALAASTAAALVVSVARKTIGAEKLRYVSVRETAETIARQADREKKRLLELVDLDASAFGPVIALRRETGRLIDPILQDASLRAEIDSLRPATEIPQEIAERSIHVANHAAKLFDIGYQAAKGESFTALKIAIAAAEGAIAVAQINIATVRTRAARFHDQDFERDWLERMRVRTQELRVHLRLVKRRQLEIVRQLEKQTSRATTKTKSARRPRQR